MATTQGFVRLERTKLQENCLWRYKIYESDVRETSAIPGVISDVECLFERMAQVARGGVPSSPNSFPEPQAPKWGFYYTLAWRKTESSPDLTYIICADGELQTEGQAATVDEIRERLQGLMTYRTREYQLTANRKSPSTWGSLRVVEVETQEDFCDKYHEDDTTSDRSASDEDANLCEGLLVPETPGSLDDLEDTAERNRTKTELEESNEDPQRRQEEKELKGKQRQPVEQEWDWEENQEKRHDGQTTGTHICEEVRAKEHSDDEESVTNGKNEKQKYEDNREQQEKQEKKGDGEMKQKRMERMIEKKEELKAIWPEETDGKESVKNHVTSRGRQQEKKVREKRKKQQKEAMVEKEREEDEQLENHTPEKMKENKEEIPELNRGKARMDQKKNKRRRENMKRKTRRAEKNKKQQQQLKRGIKSEAGRNTSAGQDSSAASKIPPTQTGASDILTPEQQTADKIPARPEKDSNLSSSQGGPRVWNSRYLRPASLRLEKLWKASVIRLDIAIFVLFLLSLASAVPVSLHVQGEGTALQGEPYSLHCAATPPLASHTTSSFAWYRNGQLLTQQTDQVLNFTKLSKSDDGHYQCLLKQNSVQLSLPFSLRVTVFEKLSMVSEVEVEEGQTVILNCSVHSDPTAFLNWRVDGELVLTVRSNSYGLVLHNASRLHLAVVQCEAYNEALPLGFMSAYTLIRLKGTYEIIPRPWLGPRGTPVVHRPFGMECLVLDIPNLGVNVNLTYTWYKDHKVIEGQSDMILDIPSLRKEDSGLYTCTARNVRAETTSLESNALEVVVLVPPVVHMEPQTPDTTVHGAAGHNLTLTCKVTEAFPGVAPDGYRWSYLPSPQAQLRPLEGRESTLTLGPLTREDRGQYFCQARNYEDFDGLLPPGNASVTVDVLCLGPIILTPDLQVNEGEPVNLTCHVDCDPSFRLAWTVGGAEVRHVTAKVDHYVILSAACSDSQTYVCGASNPDLHGLEIHASTHVLVNCSSPAEVNVTRKIHANTTEPVPAEWNTTALAIALPIVVIALAVIIVVVVCIVRKRRERCCETEADKKDEERKPMNV